MSPSLCLGYEIIVVAGLIRGPAQTVLFQVVGAGNGFGTLARLVQGRQQHGGKNGDDRYSNDDAINKFHIISSLSSIHILCLYLCRVAILPD